MRIAELLWAFMMTSMHLHPSISATKPNSGLLGICQVRIQCLTQHQHRKWDTRTFLDFIPTAYLPTIRYKSCVFFCSCKGAPKLIQGWLAGKTWSTQLSSVTQILGVWGWLLSVLGVGCYLCRVQISRCFSGRVGRKTVSNVDVSLGPSTAIVSFSIA